MSNWLSPLTRDGLVTLGIASGIFAIVVWPLIRVLRWSLSRLLAIIAFRSVANIGMSREAIIARNANFVSLPARYLAIGIGLSVARLIILWNPIAPLLALVAYTLASVAVALLVGRVLNNLYLVPNHPFRMVGLSVDAQLVPFVQTFVWFAIIFFGLVANLQYWGFDATGLLAGTGLFGLAISLAAKDSATNLLGYFIIVAEHPFLIGDLIKTGDVTGTVERVGWRSTKVRQADQVLVIVPNGNLIAEDIYNSFRTSKHLVDCVIAVPYATGASAIEQLLRDLREEIGNTPNVDHDAIVVVRQITRDAIEIGITCHLSLADRSTFVYEQEAIYLRILRVVEASGITLAGAPAPVAVPASAVGQSNGHSE